MRVRALPVVVTATAIVTASLLAGCAGSGGTSSASGNPTPSASAPSSATKVAGPTPAATEINPPGDIPDNQAFVPYAPAGQGYTVSVPEGWSRSGSGARTTFTDKLNSIHVETGTTPTVPTVASVTGKDVAALAATAPAFALDKVSVVTRNAGKAVLVTYGADSAVNPVTGKVVRDAVERYTFWRGGRTVTLTLVAPKGSDNVDPWRTVTDSFAWTR